MKAVPTFLSVCVLAALPVSALAQAESEPLALTISHGKASAEYLADDVSLYTSTTPAYDDVSAATDVSLSISNFGPIDAELLEWAAQGAEDRPLRDISFVTTVADRDGGDREVRYEVTGAYVTSLSTSFSAYSQGMISLQVMAEKLIIDGIAMN